MKGTGKKSRKKRGNKGKRGNRLSGSKSEQEPISYENTNTQEMDRTQVLFEIYTECRSLSRIMERMAKVYSVINDNKIEVNN